MTRPEQIFLMLEEGRLDYGIVGYLSGLNTLKKLGLTDIYPLQPSLWEFPLVLVLSEKKKAFIPAIDAAIESMKQDGTIDRLYQKTISNLAVIHPATQ